MTFANSCVCVSGLCVADLAININTNTIAKDTYDCSGGIFGCTDTSWAS